MTLLIVDQLLVFAGIVIIRMGIELSEHALYDGDPTLINTELDELLAITPEQIRQAVEKFLNTENRSLLDVVPAGQG